MSLKPLLAGATAVVALVLGVLTVPSTTAVAAESATSVASSLADTALGGPVKTADLSKFQPGNIISDAVFFDSGAMTEAEIQTFLESKVRTCSTNFVCLKDWYDTTRSIPADAMCGAYQGGTRERASRIIYKVAQACGINPQVIIVMLQKEQGLILSSAPSAWNYQAAMGQGCPDTAACDTRYYGFFNQVQGGAWQFKRYANPPGTAKVFTWYAPGKTWNVRYHPNADCGSSPVYIQNQATANLYYYTPYQPNGAALASGYNASSDPCSSYGNRNFYQFFTDWFATVPLPTIGSVTASSYVIALGATGAIIGYPFGAAGRWGTAVQLGIAAPGTVSVMSVGDLDGDGTRDLIGLDGAGAVSMYPGARTGAAFGAAQPRAVAGIPAGLKAPAGDFDGDTIPDLFTIDAAGFLQLWRGTTAASFRAPIVVGNGWGSMTALVGATDFNRDGAPDLIARHSSGTLTMYLGNGRGGWLGGIPIGQGWGGMTSIISPGDFGGDGLPDVLARDGNGRLFYYHGTGTGRIGGGTEVGWGWNEFADLSGPGPAVKSPRALPSGAGDVDSDGARDVLAVDGGGQIVAFRGDGRGSWRGTLATGVVLPSGARMITMGDFTGDGVSDVGHVNPDGTFDLRSGRGDGTFATAVRIGNGWSAFTAIIGGIDFDGDRRTDVLARDAAGTLYLYRGTGTGGWVGEGSAIGSGWSSLTAIFAAGDFDGDSAADVIVRADDGSLWIYPTSGSGNWGTPRQIGSGWGGFTALFGPGDFDGSQGADVLARAANGNLILYRGNGSGGWGTVTSIGQGWGGLSYLG